MDEGHANATRQAALDYHALPKPGKLEIRATKPLANGRDLSLAYSPGVAEACLEIKADPATASRYTARGNLVAVVSNGTAVLGLGNIGAMASKPVMEGKAVLFKKFANIDCFDIELNEPDPVKLADIVCALEPTFGAINLEDIKAPDCFIVEQLCRERMNIPVFHDDQHGTAIVVGAAATNALIVTKKRFDQIRVVSTGGGAAGIACLEMLVNLGVRRENIWLCDLGAGLPRPRRSDDAAEGRLRAGHHPGNAGRGDRRRRSFPGPVGPRRADARDGGKDGARPDRLRAGQSHAGNPARPGALGRAGCDHRHGAQRFSQPGQQRPVLPLHLPRRAGRGGHHDQQGYGTGLHRGHRGAGPRHHQRRGRRRLPRRDAEFRPRLPDPQALRPAADGRRRQRGGTRGDGNRRRHAAPARSRRLQAPA
jgi:hypothetical protein